MRSTLLIFCLGSCLSGLGCGSDPPPADSDITCEGVGCDEETDSGGGGNRDVALPDATPGEDDAEDGPDTDAADVSPPDADTDGMQDTSDDTSADVEITEDVDPATDVVAPFRLQITAPTEGASFRAGAPVRFEAQLVGIEAPETAALQWLSDRDGFLSDASADGSGLVAFETSDLSSGVHLVELEGTVPGLGTSSDSVQVVVCGEPAAFTFDTDLSSDEWAVTGDAFRDERGWLEMTGNARSRQGAIVKIGDSIAPGDLRISFDISTGQCDEIGPCFPPGGGADGFAVSIYETSTAAETLELVAAADLGGALGYGLAGNYGDYVINAFHIEFDTFFNEDIGPDSHLDPTREGHVAITLNGDPGDHRLWAPLPTLEDNQWHSVSIVIVGTRVTIEYDGAIVADGDIPELSFKGGFLVFTGVTGFETNNHRFDNLVIDEQCELRD